MFSAAKWGLPAALVALVASMAIASSASADCYMTIQPIAKWKNMSGNRCIEPLEPSDGHYQDSFADWAVSGKVDKEAVSVHSESVGGIKVTDMKGGLFGEEVTIECTATDSGTVGPGSADRESELTLSSCKTTKGTCPSPKVTAVDLPWNSRLHETTKDHFEEDEKGLPAIEVECTGTKDKCEGADTAAIKNVAETESKLADVDLEFTQANAEAEPMTCSRGGAKSGLIVGTMLVSASLPLSVTSE